MRFAAATVIALTLCLVPPVSSEDKLPAQLAGTGATTDQGGKTTKAPWSLAIASQDEEGNLKGTMNWSGRACQLSGVAFAGTYRNGVLEIQAPATSSKCGAWTITLTESPGSQLLFEGTARTHGSDEVALVTLRPR